MSRANPDFDDIIDGFNTLDDLLDRLIEAQRAGKELAEAVRKFEADELIPAETAQKEALRPVRAAYDDLAAVVATQPRAEVNRRNATPNGWRFIEDSERKRLEADAARVTPEEARLNELRGQRVRLPRERLDALVEAFSTLSDDVSRYEKSLAAMLSELSEAAEKMHVDVDELAAHSGRSFSFVNAQGVRSRIEHLRNGDAVGGADPYYR